MLQGVWESDLSYILQGVVISGKHQQITLTGKGLTAVIDAGTHSVLIVACCAVPVASIEAAASVSPGLSSPNQG